MNVSPATVQYPRNPIYTLPMIMLKHGPIASRFAHSFTRSCRSGVMDSRSLCEQWLLPSRLLPNATLPATRMKPCLPDWQRDACPTGRVHHYRLSRKRHRVVWLISCEA